jgi:hypothetical protein
VVLSRLRVKLWARKVDSRGYGTVEWVLKKTIELNQLLSLRPAAVKCWQHPVILGSDEDNSNVIFEMPSMGVLMIQLESNQFTNLFNRSLYTTYFPYRSFYTAGNYSRLISVFA